MDNTDTNVAWAVQKLQSLAHLRGYPPNGESLKLVARSFLRIVHNKPVKYKGEEVNDAEKLIELCGDTCEFFPAPIQMRRIYSQYAKPATEVTEGDGA